MSLAQPVIDKRSEHSCITTHKHSIYAEITMAKILSFFDFQDSFPDEQACFEYLFKLR